MPEIRSLNPLPLADFPSVIVEARPETLRKHRASALPGDGLASELKARSPRRPPAAISISSHHATASTGLSSDESVEEPAHVTAARKMRYAAPAKKVAVASRASNKSPRLGVPGADSEADVPSTVTYESRSSGDKGVFQLSARGAENMSPNTSVPYLTLDRPVDARQEAGLKDEASQFTGNAEAGRDQARDTMYRSVQQAIAEPSIFQPRRLPQAAAAA